MNISLSDFTMVPFIVALMMGSVVSIFSFLGAMIAQDGKKTLLWLFMSVLCLFGFAFSLNERAKIERGIIWKVDTPILLYNDKGAQKVVPRHELPDSETGKYFFQKEKWVPVPPE